jgi:hypothetical protein
MARRRRPERHEVPGPSRGPGDLAPTVTVLTNSLTPWLRSRFTLREDGLHADVPRALLGLVPAGRRRVRLPLERIDDIRVSMALYPDRALVCSLLLVGAVVVTGPGRIALLALGLVLLPLSYVAVLRVDLRDVARRERFPICVFARFDARLVAAATRLEVAARLEVATRTGGDAADEVADATGEERPR